MATGDNPITPLFPGLPPLTAAVTAAVSAGKFVKISGTFTGGPLLDLSGPTTPMTTGNLMQVATCTAAAKAFGVARFDAATAGDVLGVFLTGTIVPMVCGTGGITAGQEVESDGSGNPITLASGRPCGVAISTATATNVVYIRLY